jgi:Flp pilus assembly pilin Flp
MSRRSTKRPKHEFLKETDAMQRIRCTLTGLHADARAVTALEHGMIAALIAVVAITGFSALGTDLSGVLSTVSSAL